MVTFQLGKVAPIVSVVYRFGLASIILFAFALITKKSFKFSARQHQLILIQGLTLFGFNYWLTYIGITHINSALAAILSTVHIYFIVVYSRLILGDPIRKEVVIGSSVGIVGIFLLFLPEMQTANEKLATWTGIICILAGSMISSLGNVLSAATQRKAVPVVQANALGMGYASILLAIIAFFSGMEFNFDTSFKYVGSLLYLAVFGSVIAFGAYLLVLGRIGADRAGYISLVYPVIAMIISTFYENYQWTIEASGGLILILFGKYIAMGQYRKLRWHKNWKQKRLANADLTPIHNEES